MFKWYFERKARSKEPLPKIDSRSRPCPPKMERPQPAPMYNRYHSTTTITRNGKTRKWVNGKEVNPKSWVYKDEDFKGFEKDMKEFAVEMKDFAKEMRDMFK